MRKLAKKVKWEGIRNEKYACFHSRGLVSKYSKGMDNKLKKRNGYFLLLVGILLIGALGVCHGPVNAAAVFSDDFEDGDYSGWTSFNGVWKVVTGNSKVYKQLSTKANTYSAAGSADWTNYAVQRPTILSRKT
jgi:hypothetical protein